MNPVLASWVTALFHLPLILAAWFVTTRVLERPPGLRALRDSFLVGCILWRAESLLLHLSGNIDGISVFVTHLLLLVAVVLVLRRRDPSLTAREDDETNRWLLGIRGTLFGVGALGAAAALFRIATLPDPYDSLTYHLMLPAHWLGRHVLDLHATSFGDIALTYTPAAVEGFFFGSMLPTGSDLLARIGQLPFFLVVLSILVELAGRGRTGMARSAAVAAPFVFLCWPRLLIQASGSMVDVAAATYFLAALLAIFRWKETDRARELVFAGALAGLFLGSRFTGVVFAPLLLAAVAPKLRWCWTEWLRFLVPLAAMGAFPYLRNLWLTGNPLYPIHLAVGDWQLLPGLFTREATLAMPFHLGFLELVTLAWYELGVLGPGVLALGLAAPLWARDATTRWCTFLAAVLIALHCAAVPYNSNLRFLFPAWGMLIVASTRALAITRPGCIVLGLLTAAALVHFVGWRLPLGLTRFSDLETGEVALWAGIVLVLGCGVGAANAQLRGARSWALPCLLAAVFVTLAGVLHEQRLHQQQRIDSRDPRFEGLVSSWEKLRELPRGRVAYCGLNLPYPLRGGAVGHSVGTVPLNGAEPNLLPHEAQRSLAAPPSRRTVHVFPDRATKDRVRWKEQLLASFDYLAIYVGPPGKKQNPVEYDWVLKDGRHFRRIDQSRAIPRRPGLQVFRLVRD